MAAADMGKVASERPQDFDHYQVLGVSFDATDEDIRRQFHTIVRKLHPDRKRPGAGGGVALERSDRFHQVKAAWDVLSNPTRRLLYDLNNFGRSSVSADRPGAPADLLRLQREQAARDVDNMQVHLQKVLRREEAVKGVVIKKALYGDLRLRSEKLEECFSSHRHIEVEDLRGPVLDVTGPLQSSVEKSTLILPGGVRASKADLPGFYNPDPLNPNVELSLYVLYDFRSQLHEVMVGDREKLRVPMRAHVVGAGKVPRGPWSPSNVALYALRDTEVATEVGATARRKKASPDEALARAVGAHMICRLTPPRNRRRDFWEVSKAEFCFVLVVAGFATAASVRWARHSQ